jgi:hypothetical protein
LTADTGGDVHHRVRQLRILPGRQTSGPQTDQQDQQADDDRQTGRLMKISVTPSQFYPGEFSSLGAVSTTAARLCQRTLGAASYQ